MSYGTFIIVAEAILKPTKPFGDERSVRIFLFSKKHSLKDVPLPETEPSSVRAMLDDYLLHHEHMLGLRSSEAAGVPLLGQILARVVGLLSTLTSAEYKTVMAFTVVTVPIAGKHPSADGAVVAIHQVMSLPSKHVLMPVVI